MIYAQVLHLKSKDLFFGDIVFNVKATLTLGCEPRHSIQKRN